MDDLNELVLRKIRIGLQARVGEDVLHSLRIDAVQDFVANEIVYTLSTYLLGNDIKREVKARIWVLDGWWDAFKQRYFPDWLKCRFPDHGEFIEQTVVYTHVCPHLDVVTRAEERRAHFQFLTPPEALQRSGR